ncbi:MAG: molybdate ABC transporter substrate-binding protein [Opitutaceae bacterium]|nr:molybdate ABC transporter substrate-binding protein [Opitutaceae bacterium]
MPRALLPLLAALLLASPAAGRPAESARVSVAAAANLAYVIDALHAGFGRFAPEVKVTSALGPTGGLFAQISHGAPFDVFLSADVDTPRALVGRGGGDAASLRVFATGRLVMWTTRTDVDLADLGTAALHPRVARIALAQPATAPYGRAAQAALERAGIGEKARPRLVFGDSLTQTVQFVETGAADLGLVALSAVKSPRLAGRGVWREISPREHPGVSLDHAVVLTSRGATNPAARRYLEFLASEAARKILREAGYATPP